MITPSKGYRCLLLTELLIIACTSYGLSQTSLIELLDSSKSWVERAEYRLVIQKISAHLAISSDYGPADYLKNTLVHSLSDEETRESVDVKKIMDSRAPVYETWTKEQQNIFKDICGNAMEKLKYEIPF